MTSHGQPENQNPTSEYTMRKMNEFYEGQVYKMFPRLPFYKTRLNHDEIMRYKTIMDSMTDKELDGQDTKHISSARKKEIARESRQDVKQVHKMLDEFNRLKKVWRSVERLMSNTKEMDMSALFWSEIATPFYLEVIPEPEKKIPPRKFESLMDEVEWDHLIYVGIFVFCVLIGMSLP